MARAQVLTATVLAVLAGWLTWSLQAVEASPAQTHGPSYTCSNKLGSEAAFNFQAYEGYLSEMDSALTRAAFNVFAGDSGFQLPALNTGPRSARVNGGAAPYTPPILLKAIAWIESGWAQAEWGVQRGTTGMALVSPDCGYGLMQVTSGMERKPADAEPTAWQTKVGTDFRYNAAAGARILANKWNLSPKYLPIVDNGDPTKVEHWYFSVWAYNGFSEKNNPNNPNLPWPRPAYKCDGTQARGDYPYQELIWGCAASPPRDSYGNRIWSPQALSLPDRRYIESDVDDRFASAGITSSDDLPASAFPGGFHTDPTRVGSPAMVLSTGASHAALVQTGQRSPSRTVRVTNTGTGLLSWTAVSSHSWLKVTSSTGVSLGSDQGSTSSSFSYYVDATSLSPGTYEGTIQVSAPSGTSGSPKTITVTVVVAGSVYSGSAPGVAR